MTVVEKAAYLKGLTEGLGIAPDSKEGKLWNALNELLSDMAHEIEDLHACYDEHDEALDEVCDELNYLEELTCDLDFPEDGDDYDDEDEDVSCCGCDRCYSDDEDEDDDDDADDANDDDIASEPFYEVACPNCGETVYVSEDDLDAGEANCAHCGVTFEVALEGDEEEPDEDAPVQYEVTCPDCGTTAVFEEEELLEGEPKCPNCGKPLDFEVTEE